MHKLYKFSLHQVVFVVPFNKEGIVVGQRTSFEKGKPVKIDYEVAVQVPDWQDHGLGISEFVGSRSQYLRVLESDLIRIEEAPAPTYKIEELVPWPSIAVGEQLDAIALDFNMVRLPGVTDADLRDQLLKALKNPIEKQKECECGKEKHGFAAHSSWCPQFKPS